jgi:hypothetical protein
LTFGEKTREYELLDPLIISHQTGVSPVQLNKDLLDPLTAERRTVALSIISAGVENGDQLFVLSGSSGWSKTFSESNH